MLNRMKIVTVKNAWPMAKGKVPGAYDAMSTAIGRATHRAAVWLPMAMINPAPMKKPDDRPAKGSQRRGPRCGGVGP